MTIKTRKEKKKGNIKVRGDSLHMALAGWLGYKQNETETEATYRHTDNQLQKSITELNYSSLMIPSPQL